MATRNEIVAEARTWLGVPWRHQGRTRRGVDCAGLVVLVARKLGLADYDVMDYGRRAIGWDFMQHFAANMDRTLIGDERPGDVILFRDAQFPCHSTIVAERRGKLTIVHSHAMRRAVVEDMLDQGEWIEKRVACFRFRDVED